MVVMVAVRWACRQGCCGRRCTRWWLGLWKSSDRCTLQRVCLYHSVCVVTYLQTPACLAAGDRARGVAGVAALLTGPRDCRAGRRDQARAPHRRYHRSSSDQRVRISGARRAVCIGVAVLRGTVQRCQCITAEGWPRRARAKGCARVPSPQRRAWRRRPCPLGRGRSLRSPRAPCPAHLLLPLARTSPCCHRHHWRRGSTVHDAAAPGGGSDARRGFLRRRRPPRGRPHPRAAGPPAGAASSPARCLRGR
jgi:hypothetical protein